MRKSGAFLLPNGTYLNLYTNKIIDGLEGNFTTLAKGLIELTNGSYFNLHTHSIV